MGARKLIRASALAVVLAITIAVPAAAKGERGTVTITGPGLSSPITLRHDDSLAWFELTGIWELKWDAPNIGGTLSPHAQLGPAYSVSAKMGPDCWGDAVHEVLYPYAPGGPQVRMLDAQRMCGEVLAGWWPAAPALLDTLFAAGLPRTAPKTAPAVVAAGAGDGDGVPMPLVIGAVVAMIAAGIAITARGRRHSDRT
jgi:hypothetical protein